MKRFCGIISLFIVLSCNEKDNVSLSESIMPLAVGNQWTFIDSTYNSSGVFIKEDTSSLRITGTIDVFVNGVEKRTYLWTWVDPNTNVIPHYSWLVYDSEDGLHIVGGKSAKGINVVYDALSEKYPVEIGESWEYRVISYTSNDSVFRITDTTMKSCVGVDVNFKTISEDLKCVKYSYERILSQQERLYRPEVDILDVPGMERLSKGMVTISYDLYYCPGRGYVGLIGRTNGVVTLRKTLHHTNF